MAAVLELKARLDALLSTAQRETTDIDLFAPIPKREECPICMITLPIIKHGALFHTCCGKTICDGCAHKSLMTEIENNGALAWDRHVCAFCRQKTEKSANKCIKLLRKQMKKNNPEAFIHIADRHKKGDGVIQSNTKALEMYVCAAELGHADAFVCIGHVYNDGMVVEQDRSKTREYYELAAKRGSLDAHQELSFSHDINGNTTECIKHLKVTASAGHQKAMDMLMNLYKQKLLSKEDLAQTLRDFQSSNNEMKSKDRDEARAFFAAAERARAR